MTPRFSSLSINKNILKKTNSLIQTRLYEEKITLNY